jgi:hypothetical protein
MLKNGQNQYLSVIWVTSAFSKPLKQLKTKILDLHLPEATETGFQSVNAFVQAGPLRKFRNNLE